MSRIEEIINDILGDYDKLSTPPEMLLMDVARAVLEEARKLADEGVYGGYNRQISLPDLERLFTDTEDHEQR